MPITLKASLPAVDPVQRLLYSAGGSKLFPGGHFRSVADIERRLMHLDRMPSSGAPSPVSPSERQALLRAENAFAPLSAAQSAHLAAAGSDRAVFLLTGQQPGLLGGPVLWSYKALTCAALARDCAARLGRPVIPVFWVAGDDSDLRECNYLELLEGGAEGAPSVLSLDFPDPARPLAVGARPIPPESMATLLGKLAGVWRPETLAAVRACYPDGSTLADGFLRLAHARLAEEGILFLNGFSPRLRALGRPVLLRALREWRKVEAALVSGTAALKAAGVKAQVPLREGVVHAFALVDGERRRIFAEPAPGTGGDRYYTADQPGHDLSAHLDSLALTHDVFTRPLVAEAILPVLGHVLGPAELRYFAQMAPLFQSASGDMPLVHPRMTAMAAPGPVFAEFQSKGIPVEQLAALRPSELKARLSRQAWAAHPASRELPPGPAEGWLPDVRPIHARHFPDPGPMNRLEKSLRAAWRRYQDALERLAYAGARPHDEILFARLRWLGNGAGQDRHLNFHSLLDALGAEGMAELRRALDPASTDLQVLLYQRPEAGA